MKRSSTFKIRPVRTFGGFLLRFSSLLYNIDSAFVRKWGQRVFSQSIKCYETQKAHRKTKFCFSNQQSIGLPGASCYLCQYSLFPEPPAKRDLEQNENLQKDTFQKIYFFSITQQLFAKLLSFSSNTVCHRWNCIYKFFLMKLQGKVRVSFERPGEAIHFLGNSNSFPQTNCKHIGVWRIISTLGNRGVQRGLESHMFCIKSEQRIVVIRVFQKWSTIGTRKIIQIKSIF